MNSSIVYLLALVAAISLIGFVQPINPIRISVKTARGNTIEFELNPTDTIELVKREIDNREYPADGFTEQRLYFGGRELVGDGKQQLRDYGIKDGAILIQSPTTRPLEQSVGEVGGVSRGIVTCYMRREEPDTETVRKKSSINVFVKTSHGIRIRLEIEPTESIARLKQAIENVTNVSAEDQRLYLDDNSTAHLLERRLDEDDRTTLDSYGIANDSTILQIFHPKNALELIIEPSNGQVFTSFYQPLNTIEEVKQEIRKRCGIPIDQQILSLVNGRGQLEDEGRTLESYGIESGSTIVQAYAQKADLEILVETLKGHQFVLHVERSSQVELVKREIERRDGVPFDEQQLVFAGERLKNDRTLGSYNIDTGSMLFQTLGETQKTQNIRLSIELSSGNKWELDVNPSELVDRVKSEIERREKILADRQRLVFGDHDLEPGTRLKEYNISTGDTVKQLLHAQGPILVFINTSNANLHPYQFQPWDTILNVKKLVFSLDGIPVADQEISFDHEVLLDDKRTLEHYGIKHRTYLVQRRKQQLKQI